MTLTGIIAIAPGKANPVVPVNAVLLHPAGSRAGPVCGIDQCEN
jgi:hypothetical protein